MKGYIYALFSIEDKSHPIYIGSTTQKIYKRHASHRKDYKRYKEGKLKTFTSSFILFNKFGFNGVDHKLIKEVDIEGRKELLKYERETIEEYKNKCLNVRSPYRSEEERKEQKNNIENRTKKK